MKDRWLFIASLLLATCLWLMYCLSQSYTSVMSVPVIAMSNLEGRMESASEPSVIVARCKATGYAFVKHMIDTKPVEVRFESDELIHAGGDNYVADEQALSRNFNVIFGETVEIVQLVSLSAQFSFAEEYFRKVPVEGVFDISYSPQFTAIASPEFSPDSVFVYGSPQRVGGVKAVKTRAVHLNDVKNDVQGIVSLDGIQGVRISEKEVSYSIDVSRFVDISVKADVYVHNVPKRIGFFHTPTTVDVTYRCIFPLVKDPTGLVTFYVDYDDFVNSLGGKCMIQHDELPQGVFDLFVTPEYCSCIEY